MRNQILRLLGVKCFAFIILGLVTFKSVAQNINYITRFTKLIMEGEPLSKA